jgi:lysozyme
MTPPVITDIFSQLCRDEGLQLKPYVDTEGKTSIGYGHNLSDDGIPLSVAEELLGIDVGTTVTELLTALPWFPKITDSTRASVMVNLCFNVGIGGLLEFKKFLGHMQAGEWEAAADELANSAWAAQVPNRAARLEKQLQTGEWQ